MTDTIRGRMTQSAAPAVLVDGVSKRFRLPREKVHTLKERALHPFRRPGYDTLNALRDVSFAVEPGEFFGVVGRNGSGKSTLLKCLAGIYRADAGAIYVDGRVSTFIELGVGFNPDLAAYDNVMLNATMLGLSAKETRSRFDRIIDFAELQDFTELKLKNYSSGMLVRLAFSVMIQVDAEVLLIDEVLAVGDAAFQQKCFDEFGRIRASGATVLLVTHDMGAVQRFCDRAMLLERGRLTEIGDTETVADRYLQLNFSPEARRAEADGAAPASAAAAGSAGDRVGDGRAEVVEAWVEAEQDGRVELVGLGATVAVCARVRFADRVDDPLFSIGLDNSMGKLVWGASTKFADTGGPFCAGDEVVVRFDFTSRLAPDRYALTVGVAKDREGLAWLDLRHRAATMTVAGQRSDDGLVTLPFEVSVQRQDVRASVERAAR